MDRVVYPNHSYRPPGACLFWSSGIQKRGEGSSRGLSSTECSSWGGGVTVMGYIDYMNTFNRWIEEGRPSDKAIVLYYGLLNLFNQRRWPEQTAIDNPRLLSLTRTTDKGVAKRARDDLVKAGFVEYVPGVGRGRATEYRLLEKGEDYLPIKSPPEIHPESPPPNKIKKKIKTFSGGGEGAATSEGERAVEDFATEHCDNLDVYLRMTEDVKTEVCKVTKELFKKYTTREPTQMDEARVFPYVRPLEDGPILPFPENRIQLLSYAFQQANESGKPGNWRYIIGVLANLYKRGHDTVEKAEDYDDLLGDLRGS